MAISLGKGQLEEISKEIRRQLQSIGDDEREALRQAARTKFFKTKEGKMVQHLRVMFAKEKHCGNVCSEIVSSIEERALRNMVKPFQYINLDEVVKRTAMLSLGLSNAQDLIDAVKREWYLKLPPKVRRRFNLKTK